MSIDQWSGAAAQQIERAGEHIADAPTFNDVLIELFGLPAAVKAEELLKAQRGEQTQLLGEAWHRVAHRRMYELLDEGRDTSKAGHRDYDRENDRTHTDALPCAARAPRGTATER